MQFSDDDTAFGVPFVYCIQHVRPHTTGWCTVSLVDKIPMQATTPEDAATEARANRWPIYGEPFPCEGCGQIVNRKGYHLVVVAEDGTLTDESRCPTPTPRANGRTHSWA